MLRKHAFKIGIRSMENSRKSCNNDFLATTSFITYYLYSLSCVNKIKLRSFTV